MGWLNEEPLTIRQRLAIRVLFLVVKIIEPYKFEVQLRGDWADLNRLISEKKGSKK